MISKISLTFSYGATKIRLSLEKVPESLVELIASLLFIAYLLWLLSQINS
jgi:hypothetical protein